MGIISISSSRRTVIKIVSKTVLRRCNSSTADVEIICGLALEQKDVWFYPDSSPSFVFLLEGRGTLVYLLFFLFGPIILWSSSPKDSKGRLAPKNDRSMAIVKKNEKGHPGRTCSRLSRSPKRWPSGCPPRPLAISWTRSSGPSNSRWPPPLSIHAWVARGCFCCVSKLHDETSSSWDMEKMHAAVKMKEFSQLHSSQEKAWGHN